VIAFPISESEISARLGENYTPGLITATDEYALGAMEQPLKCAAVLIPMVCKQDGWHLLLTRRTDVVATHKGQVSFPGGACDAAESMAEGTALREAEEEIGLAPADVRLLGRLNDVATITHYRVTPVVGVIPWPYMFRPEPGEVARIFSMPLTWLAERKHWTEVPFTPQGKPRPVPVITYEEYDGEILWGVSARIVLNFLSVLGN
jgi:8-oxo-dGTP pyrophosphatase MutT (NUDIX family)